MRRYKTYEEDLSDELQNKEFAQGFLITLMEGEDGLTVEEALKHTIQRMGVMEFSKLAHIPQPRIVEFLKGVRKPKPETLDIYLKPFGLKTRIAWEKVPIRKLSKLA